MSIQLPILNVLKNAAFLGIPTLIIIDETGRVITSSGRSVVSGDKEGTVSSLKLLIIFGNMHCLIMKHFCFSEISMVSRAC